MLDGAGVECEQPRHRCIARRHRDLAEREPWLPLTIHEYERLRGHTTP